MVCRKQVVAVMLSPTLVRILDTLTTVLMSHAMYSFFVLNLRNLAEDVQLPWCVKTDIVLSLPCF